MTHCTVPDCERPTSDRLCAHHLGELTAALRAIASGPQDARGVASGGLWDDLQDVVCGRVALGSGASVASTETEVRLPFNAAASSLADECANTVTSWAKDLSSGALPAWVVDTPTAATWLADHRGLLATHPAADELHDEITDVVRRVTAMVDRRADRQYLGRCGAWLDEGGEDARLAYAIYGTPKRECDALVYARPGATEATCRGCGSRWDVAARRDWLLERAEDVWLPAADVCRALSGLGTPVGTGTLASWVHRGRLTPWPYGPLRQGERRVYRVGDVLDLALSREVA